jgi:hypothetical protein
LHLKRDIVVSQTFAFSKMRVVTLYAAAAAVKAASLVSGSHDEVGGPVHVDFP